MINHRLHRFQVRITQIILLTACCLLFTTLLFAQAVPSSELINNAKEYDGKAVLYAGEVIGEIMPRGEYAWINVNDGDNAIGIWAGQVLAQDILYAGSYKLRGDEVEVSGVFHRACPEHGGDLDIHAQVIRKLSAGRPLVERLNVEKRNQAVVLFTILIFIWILTLLKRK